MSVKGGSGSAKIYRGSCAACFGGGPADELVALVLDGMTAWPTDVGWADDIVNVPVITVQRLAGNAGQYTCATPHGLHSGDKFVITGLVGSLSSFNCPSPTTVGNHSDVMLRGSNTGSVAGPFAVPTGTGVLTKVVHYTSGKLVRYIAGVWECILTHDGTPSTAPPNPTYWQPYSVLRISESNPFDFTVITTKATTNTNYGQCHFYWGTSTQTLRTGSRLADLGHPPYRRLIILELENFLFGEERQGPPNIQLLMRRAPNQSIITGDSAGLVDGQANPLAIEAEILTDPVFCAGLPTSRLNGTSWQSLADDLASSADKVYVSPYLDQESTIRDTIGTSIEYYDGWKRWNPAGLIECGRFLHDEAPPTFSDDTTIDFNDCIDEIGWKTKSWFSTFNKTLIAFRDRAAAFKDASRDYQSGVNLRVTKQRRPAKLDRPWITREVQSLAQATEWGKINARPKLADRIRVRAEKASSIEPGDLFLLTHDAVSFSVVCRCTGKSIAKPPEGSVALEFENERGIAPVPYHPTPGAVVQPAIPGPEDISLYQFFQPPSQLADGNDFGLIVLAARRMNITRGLDLWFYVDDTGPSFYDLGEQRAWAVNGTLAQDYADNLPTGGTTPPDDTTETLQLNLDEFTVQPDLDRISAAQTADAVNDNALLVILFSAATPTNFEVCTLIGIRLNAGVYKLQVRRARFGTQQRAFLTGDSAWIIFKSDLVVYSHSKFGSYAQSGSPVTAVFRLQSFTASSTADLSDANICPDIDFTFTDPWAPTVTFNSITDDGTPGGHAADFTTDYSTMTNFVISITLNSPTGQLIAGQLIAKIGSTQVTLWTGTFNPTDQENAVVPFTLPSDGEWAVYAVAQDTSGRIVTEELSGTLKIGVGSGGTTCAQPTASPPAGQVANNTVVTVTLSDSTSGVTIYYAVVALGGADPDPTSGSTAYTPYNGVGGTGPFTLNLFSGLGSPTPKTVYAVAKKSGLTNSPHARFDYWH